MIIMSLKDLLENKNNNKNQIKLKNGSIRKNQTQGRIAGEHHRSWPLCFHCRGSRSLLRDFKE